MLYGNEMTSPMAIRSRREFAAEWYCLEQFVVDSWEVIGRDNAYPTPP
jgi:hypothetical protein